MALGSFPNVQNYLSQWTETIVEKLRQSAIDEMNENKAKATFPSYADVAASTLVAGMRADLLLFNTRIEGVVIMPKSWQWLEHGRGPGKMPPEEPIIKWIVHRGFPIEITEAAKKKIKKTSKRLFITKSEITKSRKSLKQHSVLQKRKQLAFLIRRKIGKEGTRATHFFSNVITAGLINDLKNVMKEKFKKDITITLIEEVKKEIS